MKEDTVTFDREGLKRFKRAYEKARIMEMESFFFEEHDYLVDYAKYLIEYLEMRLNS